MNEKGNANDTHDSCYTNDGATMTVGLHNRPDPEAQGAPTLSSFAPIMHAKNFPTLPTPQLTGARVSVCSGLQASDR